MVCRIVARVWLAARPQLLALQGGVALIALAGPVGQAAAQPSRPNIVFIVSDDAGYADYGFMNQFTGQTTQFKTPRLDDLALQSTVFSNAYVSGQLCSFSRAGFLTGRYSQRFGFEWNMADNGAANDGLPTDQVTIMERMRDLGYRTGMVGKWHLGQAPQFHPTNQGVDEFYGVLHGARLYFESPGQPPIYRQTAPIAWQTEASFNNIPNDPTFGRMLTDAFGDEASRFIANHAADAEPFALYVPFTAPHAPNVQWKASDLAQFSGSTLSAARRGAAALAYGLDRNVGEILDRIDDPNRDGDTSDSIRDNTIVVFMNDNGGAGPGETRQVFFDKGPKRD
jgi:arylsulfatase A-like enzyme